MQVLAVLSLVVTGATAGVPQSARQVVLDEKTTGKVVPIRTARGVLTAVEFPEAFVTTPECSECDTASKPDEDAPYRLDVQHEGRYLTLLARAPRHSRADETGATLLVRLEHATLTLYLEQGDRKRADTRVVFEFPDRRADNQYLRAEREKIVAEAEAKVTKGVTERFLRAFTEPHRCTERTSRERHDDVVLTANEICRFGSDVIIVFTLENRVRPSLEVTKVVVSSGTKVQEYLSDRDRRIEFQDKRQGAIALRLEDGDNAPRRLDLTVYATGDKPKVVTLAGLEL